MRDYVLYPGISACQVKMVLGMHCAEAHNLTRVHVLRAVSLVEHQFAFFGLTDHWDASVSGPLGSAVWRRH